MPALRPGYDPPVETARQFAFRATRRNQNSRCEYLPRRQGEKDRAQQTLPQCFQRRQIIYRVKNAGECFGVLSQRLEQCSLVRERRIERFLGHSGGARYVGHCGAGIAAGREHPLGRNKDYLTPFIGRQRGRSARSSTGLFGNIGHFEGAISDSAKRPPYSLADATRRDRRSRRPGARAGGRPCPA